MKGYLITEHIEPSKLPSTLRDDVLEPKPNKGEVVVDVHTAALNFFDLLQVEGKYQIKPPHPYVAGCEFSGVISPTSPIPPGCPFTAGVTRVFGAGQGAFAEKIAVNWRNLLEVPQGVNMDEAAGLYITAPTSFAALVVRAKLKKGETLLVHAGAGGVGLAAVQIGKALGARVIATASTPSKLEVCRRVGGADEVIDYSQEGWQQKVLALTKGKGADVIYDPVGMIVPSLKCIAWNGRALVIGFAGGTIEKAPLNLVLLKNISIMGLHWGAYTRNEPERIAEVWAGILELLREGRLKGVVFDKVYQGLESIPQGLKDLAERKTWGKVVVKISKVGESSKL